ncbi:alpha/beta hydrolase [Alsobacter sp. SYSU M60028]|uniref:Alpha/beta hydrolase n=1 Tax=Alsobacter ponti TaxID=2962936 RepID=A0ABT1LA67_9HYPH|nr:alpha/beta hydrolase [Alsobacter ponti]MCP8938395.1 alpha/beta hydrolase [Alsobacter ponti]
MNEPGYDSVFVSARDGLRLHARDYGERAGDALPVVCLAGLTRNAADFHDLALALSGHARRPRRVVAPDYRGRGLSDWDGDWRRYDPRVEADDLIAVLTALGVTEAVFVGTSRGGLVTMALGAMQPGRIRGVVLNDVGPVIEAGGLIRIRAQMAGLPAPRDMAEAAQMMRHLNGAQFPKLADDDWLAWARATWREENGRLVASRDPNLLRGLEAMDLEAPLPALWPLFEALAHVPALAIRGANSDILSEATLAEMARRHPRLETLTVPDQGHAPLLRDAPTIARVAAFVARVEEPGPSPAA